MAEEAQNGSTIARDGAGERLRRRGLIAGAAALAAGLLAQNTAERVSAGVDGDVVLGASNSTANTTLISITGASSTSGYSNGYGLVVNGFDNLIGVRGYCPGSGHGVSGRTFTGDGVQGISLSNGGTGGTGVFGGAYNANGVGVYAFSLTNDSFALQAQSGLYGVYSTAPYAVWANGTNLGVVGYLGASTTGTGVIGSGGLYGVEGYTATPGGVGVYGTVNGGFGVLGNATDGYGVYGGCTNSYGVYGISGKKHGVFGTTNAAGFGGVFGQATTPGSAAIYGSTVNGGVNLATAYAGYFDGNLVAVNGAKSAAVPHPDGSHRLLYCVESPESWFEDFGKGKLVNGKADITLDADFAATVRTDDYHVFLTDHAKQHLSVTRLAASGFTVEADMEIAALKGKKASDLSGTFSYRIVARRKDINLARLAKVDLSVLKDAHDTKPPQMPKRTDLPTPPQPRQPPGHVE